ncbi:hypothetical protein [Clavibacter tessellarius]|uniref:hypothetical protein n=1 Tax=Clavibacter tessellarius TaxID=31965 RepID=UPI0032508328
MQHRGTDEGERSLTVIRPRPALLRQLGLATLALVVPLGAALLVLAVPSGNAAAVLVGVGVVALVAAVLGILYRSSYVSVDPASGDVEARFLGRRTSVRGSDVHHVVVVHVYQGLTLDTEPRLFALDADGRLLLRLDGRVHDLRTMREMAAEARPAPPRADHRAHHGAAARDAARDPPLVRAVAARRRGVLVLLGLVVIGAVVGIMALTGVPVALRL